MRTILIVAVVLAQLTVVDRALAESLQGEQLGTDANAQAVVAHPALPWRGSSFGGYLGTNPGVGLKPFHGAPEASLLTMPAAWCDHSLVPGRCRSRAEADHAWCLGRTPQPRYARCRQTMDYIGWHL